MNRMDLYLVGKHNIMKAVLDFYYSYFGNARPHILDCGCGMGTYAYKLDDESYVGLDISSNSVRVAHRVHSHSMFLVGDARMLPFRDQVFNCAVCSEVLEHIADDAIVLAELARVTNASSKLIVSVPNIDCKNVFVDWQRNLIDAEVGHYRRGYSIQGISKIIVASGFKLEKSEYNSGPITAMVEGVVIKIGGFFGYQPSNLNQLLERKKSHLANISLKIYKLLFYIIISVTYLDRLLPGHYRSNIAIAAEKVTSLEGNQTA